MAFAARALRALRRGGVAAAFAALVAPAAGSAQAVVKDVAIGRYVPYGLDAQRLRVVRVQRVDHIDGRPYVREHRATDGADAYLIVTLEVANPNATPENIPLLQVAFVTDDGRTVDPAVYGPFVGASTSAAPASATIAPKATQRLKIAVADVPDGHAVAQLLFNPNDATPAYRLRLRPSDVTTLGQLPRS